MAYGDHKKNLIKKTLEYVYIEVKIIIKLTLTIRKNVISRIRR
jgi:hypothetical protein